MILARFKAEELPYVSWPIVLADMRYWGPAYAFVNAALPKKTPRGFLLEPYLV